MTVSRKGKRGTRAGHMVPESRNRRVRRNAGLKTLTKQTDPRKGGAKISKEEWIIRCVARVVGAKAGRNYVSSDDIASDIILKLLDAGGFGWEDDAIERFCRSRARYMLLDHLSRREKSECEFNFEDEHTSIIDLAGRIPANQEMCVEASEARGLLRAIPDRHREALEILCDGGNPIHVAEEMSMTPWEAIVLIKQAREYIHRVDPA